MYALNSLKLNTADINSFVNEPKLLLLQEAYTTSTEFVLTISQFLCSVLLTRYNNL
ncbi:hypothetical protein Hanom_Chr15g01360261 [Helianthus anomalus]